MRQPQTARPSVAIATITLLTLEAWFMAYSMIRLWPQEATLRETAPTAGSAVSILSWQFEISDEGRLFLLVLFAGAFGGAVIAVRDLALGLREDDLALRAIGWYIMRPLVASGLGLGFYLVIRGGFFSPEADVQQTSPFSFVGLATLVGLFTDQAVTKLGQIANAVFSRAEEE
ncbi:MAG: hypothetical protein ACRDG5_07245 [Anaerolineales bacterium]